ncbi:MAG TPA: AAA family ATPase [Frankiaceae bacterium]|nr:AAA family ATPase [Frankiaceae bacterium]
MVGRQRELALLLQAFDRTLAEPSAHLFTLLGAAGVGKSRLLHELLSRQRRRATVLHGRCLDYGEGMTFWPIAEVVRQAVGTSAADPPGEVRDKLNRLLGGGAEAARIVDKLTALLGDAEPTVQVEELPEAVRFLLGALAAREPVVVVLDDLQWAQPALLDLLEHLADWMRDVPVLLCCLARPELLEIRPGWGGGKVNVTTILLQPLTREESAALLHHLLGGLEGAGPARERVTRAAEGNPLFLEELVAMLIDDGLLAEVDGRWVTTARLSRIVVPPTVAALLAARLDSLPPGERAVLERASVAGEVFYRDAVAALSPPHERPLVTERLLNLVRKELLRPDTSTLLGKGALRFRHLLIRDAAYRSLSKRERAELHESCATWLEETLAERIVEVEEIAGYHLEQACRYRSGLGPADARTRDLAGRSAAHLFDAGRRAFGRRDMPAAVNLLSRAESLAGAGDPVRSALLPLLGAALVEVGEFGHADVVVTKAVLAAQEQGDEQLRAQALRVRSVLHLFAHSADASGLPVTSPPPAGAGPGLAPGLGADWTLLRGVDGPARPDRVDGGPGAGAVPERSGGTAEPAIDTFAISTVLGSTPVRAGVRRCERDLAEPRTGQTEQARILAALAGLTAMEGRFDEARSRLTQAGAILDRLGLRVRAVALSYMSGFVEMLAGDLARAEEHLRRGCRDCEQMGEKYLLASLLALLGQLAYARRRDEEALRLARRSDQVAPPDGVVAHVTARAAQAKALARSGRPDEAEQLAREAVWTVEHTDLLNVHGDALLDLAEVLELGGKKTSAAAAAEDALRLYERKGNLVSARRARARRERCEGG